MKSLQADFFKVMKEGAIQYAAPLPFLGSAEISGC